MKVMMIELPQPQPYHHRTAAAVLDRFCAGETIESLSEDFGCKDSDIIETLRLEVRLHKEPKRKTHLNKLIAQYIPGEVNSTKLRKLLFIVRYASLHGYDLPNWVVPEYKAVLAKAIQEL